MTTYISLNLSESLIVKFTSKIWIIKDNIYYQLNIFKMSFIIIFIRKIHGIIQVKFVKLFEDWGLQFKQDYIMCIFKNDYKLFLLNLFIFSM